MIRTSLLALMFCALPLAQAETKKTTAPDKAPKTEKPAAPEKAPKTEKPATKPAKPTAEPDAADKALLDHADKELKKLTPAQTASLLKLSNDGSPADLQTIPGVGETKAAAIKKARPIKTASALIMVDGIGEATFDGIVKWVKDGMPKDAAPAAKPAAKPEAKPPVKPDAKPPTKPEAAKPTKPVVKPAPKVG
jgi:DNA uptake protein ComE-like DNA-binding protein